MASVPPSSPSSSPRLPSPPPMAEDQTAPQSPGLRASDSGLRFQSAPAEQAASRRIRPGTKAADIAEGPPLAELTEIDSAFQLTEHLKALYYSHTHPSHHPAITLPITAPVALLLTTPPSSTDRALWLYELCRFLVQKANLVVTSLFADQPPCSATTCPEMRASEWQYLCAVHDPPKACCAIDYCCHTLDWAANVLTNPKHFPSRLALGTENTAPQNQVRHLTNVFRRVYRIFAHAWFSHREMFWRVEGQTGLYVFFKTVCDVYNLLPEDGYTIPAEAENREQEPFAAVETTEQAGSEASAPPPPTILKRPPPPTSAEPEARAPPVATPATAQSSDQLKQPNTPAPINTTVTSNTTSRRHRQTPSVGASPVETVPEENEEDDSSPAEPPEDPRPSQPEPRRQDLPSPLHLPPQGQTQSHAFSPFSQDPNPTPTPSSAREEGLFFLVMPMADAGAGSAVEPRVVETEVTDLLSPVGDAGVNVTEALSGLRADVEDTSSTTASNTGLTENSMELKSASGSGSSEGDDGTVEVSSGKPDSKTAADDGGESVGKAKEAETEVSTTSQELEEHGSEREAMAQSTDTDANADVVPGT